MADNNTQSNDNLLNWSHDMQFKPVTLNCSHYNRGCLLLYPCCDEFYSCRFCHDGAKNDYKLDKKLIHNCNRYLVEKVKCKFCGSIQNMSSQCTHCSEIFGIYYCDICKFLDLDDKQQFHCGLCGICRQGGATNFKHCISCGICISIKDDNHKCVRKLDGTCPICYQNLFDYTKTMSSMKCGHWIHTECLNEHLKYDIKCPLCLKTLVENINNDYLEHAINTTEMPEEYRDKTVEILCNDCNKKSKVKFHFYGHKCNDCQSYNTRLI